MDVNVLRSQLQFSCKDELQNLTTADLVDCKWPTKRRVFSSLLTRSPSLRAECDELSELEEQRQTEVNELAAQIKSGVNPALRDKRLETETTYRTKFLRLILQGLTRLRWPPALEAFADPLNDLFHDNAVIHDAMFYLLKYGAPDFIEHRSPVRKEARIMPEEQESEEQRSPVRRNSVSSAPSPKINTSLSRLTDATVHDNRDSNSLGGQRQGPGGRLRGRSLLRASPIAPNPNISITSLSERSLDISSSGGDSQYVSNNAINRELPDSDTRSVASSMARGSTSGSAAHGGSGFVNDTTLKRSYEILMVRNSLLTKKCQNLQDFVAARRLAEDKIEAILLELASLLASAATTGSREDNSSNVNSNKSQYPQSLASVVGLNDADAESSSSNAKQYLGTAGSATEKKNALSSSKRSTAISSASYSSSSSSQDDQAQSRRNAAPGEGAYKSAVPRQVLSAASPPIRLDPATARRIESLLAQWKSARRDAQQATTLAIGLDSDALHSLSLSSASASSSSVQRITPIDVQARILLGYGPPIPVSSSSSSRNFDGSYAGEGLSSSAAVVADRLQVFQRDLLYFSTNALDIAQNLSSTTSSALSSSVSGGCSQCSSNSGGAGGSRPGLHLPSTSRDIKLWKAVDNLCIQSQDLLLHMAYAAPLTPLTDTECEISATTGLETLVDEVTSALGSVKGVSKSALQRIQRAGDRARSEQRSLVRCLAATRACLSKWPLAAEHSAEVVESIRGKHASMFKKAIHDINGVQQAAAQLTQLYDGAASARISTEQLQPFKVAAVSATSSSSSTAKSATISPLDALCRGLLGDKVAGLINSLKIHLDELDNAKSTLSSLSSKLDEEIQHELGAFSELKMNLETAGRTARELLGRQVIT